MAKILIVDKRNEQRKHLKSLLLQQKYEVIESEDSNTAFTIFQKKNPDLVITETLYNDNGASLMFAQRIRQVEKRIPVIMITDSHSEDIAIHALRIGIKDYFKYPFNPEELLESVKRCLSDFCSRASRFKKDRKNRSFISRKKIIGYHPLMREVKKQIEKIAPTDSNVFISGETGTGKELVAELIHLNSNRTTNPFVCINCTAIPDTLLESEFFGYEKGAFTGADSVKVGKLQRAEGGTVFFDEIGDMSLYHQAKILRVIENKQIQRLGGTESIPLDFRVITATNQDLEKLISERQFRKDLYYRLNVENIYLPPLRERKEDIPLLIDYYRKAFNLQFGRYIEKFDEALMVYLFKYNWPGNVRELKNLVEAAIVNASHKRISFTDLPEKLSRKLTSSTFFSETEYNRLLAALITTNWNKSKAAQKLKWSRMTLYRKMTQYNIITPGNA